jgi:hypothetical protein
MTIKYQTKITYRNDTKTTALYVTYTRHGQWHRIGGPAILWLDDDPVEWYQYGKYINDPDI